jgi:hypothetical protein
VSAEPGDAAPDPAECARVGDYARELVELRRVLDESPVVGHPRRDAELAELRRLVTRYPEEARHILDDGG